MGDVIGRIEIVMMRDGKLPSNIDGLNDFQVTEALSALLMHHARKTAGKPLLLNERIKKGLYESLLHIFGGDDGLPIINGLAWCISRINLRMARDKRIDTDLFMELRPDILPKS